MRVLVASGFEALSQYAHAINTVKMAQGFARLGHEVTLLCRRSPEGKVSPEELAAIYGLTEPIDWIQLPRKLICCPVGEHWRFSVLALHGLPSTRPDLVFSRNYIFPWLSSKLGIATIAESHAHPDLKTAPFMRLVDASRHRAFHAWITISQTLADHYHSIGVPREKLMVLPDAVDLHLFQRPPQLPPSPFPNSRPNVVYAGHLYDYKGVPTLLETAARLPDVNFHFVGGWPEDIARHQRRVQELDLQNVRFHGLKPHASVPPFLWHADVLLLPPSMKHPSSAWTSPVKLGEYLASGTPLVATDIPALRDWITDKEAEIVAPDNVGGLAEGIQRLLHDKQRAEGLCEAGLERAQQLSYERRAEAILLRLESRLS